MTKNELKGLIKECLMEILVEGVGENLHTLVEGKKTRKTNKKTHKNLSTRKSVGPRTARKKKLDEHMQSNIKELTPDPIMASIFADTAMTTLTEQSSIVASSGRLGGAPEDEASKATKKMNPMQLDGSTNWAKLAFDW